MSHSWLQRKRKGELIELAQKAGLPDADGYLKDDLVELLEEHLNSHETTYAKQADFRDYYGRSGSPVKRERASPSEAVTLTKSRRRTLVKAPSEEPTPEKALSAPSTSALVTHTPRALNRRVSEVLSEVDIPASPAQLAEVADHSFQIVKAKTTELWDKTQIDYFKELVRENASSVATIQTLILLIEAAGLQWNTLQTTTTFALSDSVSKYTNSQYLFIPDFLALLTSDWWAPATLWSLTNWVLPLIFSYFFNLTLRSNTNRKSTDRQYPADPLTFNILKAILAYSAYKFPVVDPALTTNPGIVQANDLSWGPFAAETVGIVRNSVPGGYYGLQIGAVVGVLISLYDAALKK
ncbi:hypothetical protein EK21DRAFT_79150 [Setomelanomma holmii]|uniref:Uncharacterized protein n=1 Tax=Setomelanomma holmii TaxID=210430 RepID=A0A9P4GY79_9PLEO|nr:hypothetical protein EK21DRAFT_79150 [Setomelanomma holmii]